MSIEEPNNPRSWQITNNPIKPTELATYGTGPWLNGWLPLEVIKKKQAQNKAGLKLDYFCIYQSTC